MQKHDTEEPTNTNSPPVGNPEISTHAVTTDRTILIEQDNTDGWISADFTVPITQ